MHACVRWALPLVVVLAGLAGWLTESAAQSPASIPSPRPQGWVVDLVQVLAPAEVQALNSLGEVVHARDGAELAVVIIASTGGRDARQFATELFNRWGIGRHGRDNGLLLFVALHDHAAEIILGNGIDSDAGVATSERIMQQTIVPRFRVGDNAGAVLAGARACAESFFGATVATTTNATPAPSPTPDVERAVPQVRVNNPSSRPTNRRPLLFGAGAVASAVVGLAGWIAFRAYRRQRPRRCPHCALTMQLLDEVADDAHLSASERVEERLQSVDYDVWHCPGCGSIEKVRYGRWFSKYAKCPQCGAATKSHTEQVVIAATTMSAGLMRIHEQCENCSFVRSYERSIPMQTTSRQRSPSGFSGGRSSGRGASGRW